MDEDQDSSDDEASSEDEKESKKKGKKKDKDEDKKKDKKAKEKEKEKDKKKRKKKAKKSESSDESESSSSESEEETKAKDKKSKFNGKTKEPEISKPAGPTQGKLSKISAMPKQNKAKQEPPQPAQSTKKQQKVDNSNILEMDFGFDNNETVNKNEESNQEWTEFGTTTAPKAPENSNELFNAFGSNQNSGKTDDLIKSLGNLYSQTPQPQYQQFPQYPPQNYPTNYPQGYPQAPVQSSGFPPAYGYQGYTNQYAAPAKPENAPQPSYDDPFASIIEEQQKKQSEEMQKAQAAKFMQQPAPAAPGGYNQPPTGMTPNMFFQQMMAFMQSASGQQPNTNQNAMMMAAMQNMMAQMSMNNQAAVPKQEPQETLLEESAPDPNKGMFKSLFNDATTSAFSQQKPSDFGFKAQHTAPTAAPTTSPYAPFSAPAPAPATVTRHSEPSNPFGSFGSNTAPSSGAMGTSQSTGLFDTQFSNSGFKSGGKLAILCYLLIIKLWAAVSRVAKYNEYRWTSKAKHHIVKSLRYV